MISLYTDGGLIGSNPSPIGGVWAWCAVENNLIVKSDCGVFEASKLKTGLVSNNVMELYAALSALDEMKANWSGILWTDSMVTKCRLNGGGKPKQLPKWLQDWLAVAVKNKVYMGRQIWRVRLLGGHPSKSELLAGQRRDGTPVSLWNQWCDRKCRELATRFMEKVG